jgi:hypothetical protein
MGKPLGIFISFKATENCNCNSESIEGKSINRDLSHPHKDRVYIFGRAH